MNLSRTLSKLLAVAVAAMMPALAAAQDLVPGSPTATMSFEIDGDNGKVVGTVTAPSKDSAWQELPADTRMDIVVTRSCYSLGESKIKVAEFSGLAPGESRDFTDTAEPAWQYGQDYTYNPVASINGNSGWEGYASLRPGISFAFAYGVVTVTQVEAGDSFHTKISAVVPDKTSGYPATDLPMDMTALKFFRVTDSSVWPYQTELINQIDNPEKGKAYEYIDQSPTVNAKNIYVVRCESKFGFAETNTETYVGWDVPMAPYPVNAVAVDGGNKITWSAPTSGKNYGQIKPEDTFYNVYRCWGRMADQREQIATNLKQTEFIDTGEGMEFPRQVNYEVEACNNIGVGGSNTSSSVYELLIGPAESIPFVESFDSGMAHVWQIKNGSYYAQMNTGTEAEYGGNTIAPHSGTGLIYVDYSYSYSAATNELASYKIDIAGSDCLGVSFWYYAIPANDVTIDLQVKKDAGEFESLRKVAISDDVTDAGWKKVFVPLTGTDGVSTITLKLVTAYEATKAPAIIDDIMVLNYPKVGDIAVEYDPEACTATLTWDDPSTEYASVVKYTATVDGEDKGEVTSPWVFEAPEYRTAYNIAIQAVYEDITAPASEPVTVSVPRPKFTEFTISDHVFEIVQDLPVGTNHVVVKAYNGTDALYKVPERVSYDNVSYEVVGIGASAYAGNTSIVSVNMHDDLVTIGQEAFMGCTGLEAVTFGKGLSAIGSRAFAGCSALSLVVFSAPGIPDVADDAFEGIAAGCKGQCPAESLEAYATHPGLQGIDFGWTGIGLVYGDSSADVEYFDMAGRPVDAPAPGTTVIARITAADGTMKVIKTMAR